jgi:hypothetical protein
VLRRRSRTKWKNKPMRKLNTAALIALLAMGCAEYLPLPSGALQGTISPLPQSLEKSLKIK